MHWETYRAQSWPRTARDTRDLPDSGPKLNQLNRSAVNSVCWLVDCVYVQATSRPSSKRTVALNGINLQKQLSIKSQWCVGLLDFITYAAGPQKIALNSLNYADIRWDLMDT